MPISDIRKPVSQDLESEVFFSPPHVSSPLDDSNLVVEAFGKARGDFCFGRTVCRDSCPIPFQDFFERGHFAKFLRD